MIAREHVHVVSEFSNKYHSFWAAQNGFPAWDPEVYDDQCVPSKFPHLP